MSGCPATGDEGYPPPEQFAGAAGAVWRRAGGAVVAVALGHQAQEGGEPVRVGGAAGAGLPAGELAERGPDHAVLGGEAGELLQGAQLFAAPPGGVGGTPPRACPARAARGTGGVVVLP